LRAAREPDTWLGVKPRDVVDFLLLAAMWGASFLFLRSAVPEFGPFALMWVRVLVASLLLVPLVAARGAMKDLLAHWRAVLVLGAFSAAIPFVLLAFAALRLTAGFTAIVNATTALWTALLAVLWLGDRLTRARWIGVALGILGVALLVWDRIGLKSSDGAGVSVLAGLGAAASYGYAANLTRKYWQQLPTLVAATASQLGAAIVLLPLALWTWPATLPSASAWGAAVAMGAFSSALGYLLFFRLITRVGGVTAASVTLVVPVFAVGWGALFLSEAITLRMALGGLVVLLGTSLSMGLLTVPSVRRRLTG
jgi:drug/metabolite transporter (DMT)-like permease